MPFLFIHAISILETFPYLSKKHTAILMQIVHDKIAALFVFI